MNRRLSSGQSRYELKQVMVWAPIDSALLSTIRPFSLIWSMHCFSLCTAPISPPFPWNSQKLRSWRHPENNNNRNHPPRSRITQWNTLQKRISEFSLTTQADNVKNLKREINWNLIFEKNLISLPKSLLGGKHDRSREYQRLERFQSIWLTRRVQKQMFRVRFSYPMASRYMWFVPKAFGAEL